MSESDRQLAAPSAVCPGLDPAQRWDEASHLRGELYTREQLDAHGRALAQAHGEPEPGSSRGPLVERIANARQRASEVYSILGRQARRRAERSAAEERLLAEASLVEEQLREIGSQLGPAVLRTLPRLGLGSMRGYPRLYALCLDYLRHTDGRVDAELLESYLHSYQSVRRLTLAELGALPALLRLGLLLWLGALGASDESEQERISADSWAERLAATLADPAETQAVLAELERTPRSPAFLVRLIQRQREQDGPLEATRSWVATRCAALGSTPEELARREHRRQAADHVALANALGSMRAISAIDFDGLFARTSDVERVLRADPAGIYARCDRATLSEYRRAIEELARRSRKGELDVARAAVELARGRSAHGSSVSAHVGSYLIAEERGELERRIGYRPSLGASIRQTLLESPAALQFGTAGAITALELWAFGAALRTSGVGWPMLVTLLLALLLPASEVALGLCSALGALTFPPRRLPKLDFSSGIPDDQRTLIAVPALIESERAVERLLASLRVCSLANPDPGLRFALVTDLADAPSAELPGDAELLERLRLGIEALDAGQPARRHWLLHRRRVQSDGEGAFIGWERKRGKLDELNRLLRGDESTTFSLVSAPREQFAGVRYVIALDADTLLAPGAAAGLVGAAAHPLNRPELSADGRRVVRGYAILQPRLGTSPRSARRSRLSAILAGPAALDRYPEPLADAGQDLFGEGWFAGNGIYDVDAFQAALAGRMPEGRVLSHALLEGIYARAGLLTDVEVLEEQPSSYAAQMARQHRWMRGDWQLSSWLAARVPAARGEVASELRGLDMWRIADELRRSLLAPALVLLVLLGWCCHPPAAGVVLAAFAAVFILPLATRLALSVVRDATRPTRPRLGSFGGDLDTSTGRALLNLVFLLDLACLSLDAAVRALYRLRVSRRHLLDWTPTRAYERTPAAASIPRRSWLTSSVSALSCAGVLWFRPDTWPLAVPLLLGWAVAPIAAAWISEPLPETGAAAELPESDQRLLWTLAQRSWRYFDELVGDADQHLPPESFQEDPRGVIAHRSTPADIGLYLLGLVGARDFGFITTRELRRRLELTFGTLDVLEKYDGHPLHAYETNTLRALEPQRVSSVGSGILGASCWVVREACLELSAAPLVSSHTLAAVSDALRLAREALAAALTRRTAGPGVERESSEAELEALAGRAAELCEAEPGLGELLAAFGQLQSAIVEARRGVEAIGGGVDAVCWLARAEQLCSRSADQLRTLAPWLARAGLERLASVPELSADVARLWARLEARVDARSIATLARDVQDELVAWRARLETADVSRELRLACHSELEAFARLLAGGSAASLELCQGLAKIGERAAALADGMRFQLVFDRGRQLLATGFDLGTGRQEPARHELLASEARLASFFGIAKGDLPEQHWYRLARPYVQNAGGRALLSQGGSLSEYLLPLLWLDSRDGTLLGDAYHAAIARQRQHAVRQGVPWGSSESACNVLDPRMSYLSRTFGVPGLGLRAGLGSDLVIAPYATALAGLVRPDLVGKNLRALSHEGLDGAYGYYDAIDYTPDHLPPGRRGVVLSTFIGRHQATTLVALANILLAAPMQRRFARNPRVEAVELLLEERSGQPLPRTPLGATSMATRVEPRVEAIERTGLRSPGPLRVQLLGHGALSALVSATGTGVNTWRGLDVGRFREDPVLEAGGTFLYIKNRTHNRLWSAAYQPTRAEPSFYNVAFSLDRVEFHRRDGDVQTVTSVALSPEHPVEVRRVTLNNQGEGPLELEVTSYTEVVLAPRGADVDQRAFSNMFVETEALPDRYALLARRRPRVASEPEVWLLQVLIAESGNFGPLDYDCSRHGFIGRGRSSASPAALDKDVPLGRRAGSMLDTALALRRGVRLAPGASARLTLVTGLAQSRSDALGLLDAYSGRHAVTRAVELGWAAVGVELRHLGVSPADVHRYQRLLSAVVFPHAMLRQTRRALRSGGRGLPALRATGISGDLPIVVCRVDDAEFAELVRELVVAHEFWRHSGFASDLVLIDERGAAEPASVVEAVRELGAHAALDQRGGVFLRRLEQLQEEERELLLGCARVVLAASEGTLARQLRRVLDTRPLPPALARHPGPLAARPPEPAFQRPKLTYDNGIGGFGADGREYIMVLEPGVGTPSPWCNVIANPSFGTLVSEVGSSFTWAKNSQRHRLTPWSNDVVCDPPGERLYVRDEEDGSCWSATPAPLGRGARYLVRHGQGYSQFEHERAGLRHELTLFVSPDEPLKISRLRLENRGQQARRLSLFAVVDWVLGTSRESSRVAIATSYDATDQTLYAHNPIGLFPSEPAFLSASLPITSVSGDREEVFGVSSSLDAPESLLRARLSGQVGVGLDPAGALHIEMEVRAGETLDVSILLGHAASTAQAQDLVAKYRREGAVNDALARARKLWVDLLGAVRVKTPDRALDLMQNNWLLYQSLSSRVWGRTGFFQSSGAYGYRDQLQDVLVSVHARPAIAREHILRCASRQFPEGDVQHWWHDETGEGVRTRCSDDMLWLPYVTAEYVRVTGDRSLLDEQVPFLAERRLEPGEDEIFSAPPPSTERASLYEHCKRALDAGMTAGEHGLPLMRAGDWNAGMNRVGIEGRGESVWLAWFLAKTLTEFSHVAHLVGDTERAASCLSRAKRIAKAVDEHAWDGQWYRRASFDDGSWLGSQANAECKIDAIAQSWAVIAGLGDPERAANAVAAAEARLIVPSMRMMKLLDPPLSRTRPDPGYIQAYPAGIRENGGQYTHGALWTVLALSLLGAGDRAGELLGLLTPIRHGDTPDGVERYRVEPYVIAADVYAGSGHEGRGGWTWYTGAAGWMYRIGLEHVIGLRRRGRTLAITPCIPSTWDRFEIEYKFGSATYHIVVDNAERVCQGVLRLEVDGQRIADGYIRLESDDRVHEVRVTLGRVLPSRSMRAPGFGTSQA